MKSCPFADCRKSLSTAYKLKLHIQRCHYNLRLYQCSHCLKHFKSNDSLKRHLFCHREAAGTSRKCGKDSRAWGEVVVPKLTSLLLDCADTDLRPMVHIDRVYPYSYHFTKVQLPAIASQPSAAESPQ